MRMSFIIFFIAIVACSVSNCVGFEQLHAWRYKLLGQVGHDWSNLSRILPPRLGTISTKGVSSTVLSAIIFMGLPASIAPQTVNAAMATVMDFNDVRRLKAGLREIEFLLDNWDDKTTYCNFGEFQNELLLPESKEKLFKAAAETGLLDYDKSATMNIRCRKDPEVVRAFLGLTPDNTLLNKADVLMRKPAVLEMVDGDALDEYLNRVELYTQAVAAADSLAYAARTDYASQQTSSKEDSMNGVNSSRYLSQSKSSVVIVRDSLRFIVDQLHI